MMERRVGKVSPQVQGLAGQGFYCEVVRKLGMGKNREKLEIDRLQSRKEVGKGGEEVKKVNDSLFNPCPAHRTVSPTPFEGSSRDRLSALSYIQPMPFLTWKPCSVGRRPPQVCKSTILWGSFFLR